MSTIREYLEKIKTAVHGKDVRQAINDAIRQCYDDGRAGAIDLQAREDISGLDEKKADKTALLQEKEERKNEIAVERERINNLAKLEPGSTTGDAELVDARVDKNGNAHDNVGEHIREVTSQLSEEIENVFNEIGESQEVALTWTNQIVAIEGFITDSETRILSQSLNGVNRVYSTNSNYVILVHAFDVDDGTYMGRWVGDRFSLNLEETGAYVNALNLDGYGNYNFYLQVKHSNDGNIDPSAGENIRAFTFISAVDSLRYELNNYNMMSKFPNQIRYKCVLGIVDWRVYGLTESGSGKANCILVDIQETITDCLHIVPINNNRFRVALSDYTVEELLTIELPSSNIIQGSYINMDESLPSKFILDTKQRGKTLLIYLGVSKNADVSVYPFSIGTSVKALEETVENLCNEATKKTYPIIGSPTFCVSTEIESKNIDTMTHDELYAVYDNLLAEYPEWICRSADIGEDSAGNPIRHYIVRMQKPVTNGADYPNVESNEWLDKYDYKNILINAGTHGDEKTSVYGTALFVDELVKSTEDWAVFIKSNFILHIIPLLNVWGFDNFSRENVNAINVNRDFADFATSESIALINLIESLGEKLRVIIDSHNTQSNIGFLGVPPTCEKWDMYLQSATKYAASNYERLTRFYGNKALFPYFYGWKSSSGGGTLAAWGNEHNYYASTVEAPRAINGGANNDAKTCTLVKDTLGTFIQMFGVLD